MNKRAKLVLAAFMAATTMTAAQPASAAGSRIDPNGVWAWFMSLFSDHGSQVDPDGITKRG